MGRLEKSKPIPFEDITYRAKFYHKRNQHRTLTYRAFEDSSNKEIEERRINLQHQSALSTLEMLNYTFWEGDLWKPPRGDAPELYESIKVVVVGKHTLDESTMLVDVHAKNVNSKLEEQAVQGFTYFQDSRLKEIGDTAEFYSVLALNVPHTTSPFGKRMYILGESNVTENNR